MIKKRLSIKLVGHDYVPAFPNKRKTSDPKDANLPDYTADGVAVWVHEYDDKEEEENARTVTTSN